MGRFAHVAEAEVLVNHYGLPAVSMRSVLLPKLLRDEPGFRQRDIMCSRRDLTLLGHQCGPQPNRSNYLFILSYYAVMRCFKRRALDGGKPQCLAATVRHAMQLQTIKRLIVDIHCSSCCQTNLPLNVQSAALRVKNCSSPCDG